MYESKFHNLLSRKKFTIRILKHIAWALLVILLVLCLGVLGNVWFEHISFHDAVLNIALTVSGIGPFVLPQTVGGKVFFSAFSIFVGIVFTASIGMILAPVAHRVLHKFHLDTSGTDDDD
ncbi:two pore domain potassium channel family protein [Orrella sp. 11846]|uniref:two pore domain potassium channel family protein n=1 Tax=Orrella sp. 11846 TaxID=3409913 RepID=UPI003B5B4E2B